MHTIGHLKLRNPNWLFLKIRTSSEYQIKDQQQPSPIKKFCSSSITVDKFWILIGF